MFTVMLDLPGAKGYVEFRSPVVPSVGDDVTYMGVCYLVTKVTWHVADPGSRPEGAGFSQVIVEGLPR